MTVDAAANIVGYDDYYPYGMVMSTRSFTSSPDNRYKFTSKERDAETMYDYFGARYYDSRIGRWLSVDPMAAARPGLSPYNYCQNNPIILIDPDGALDDWVQDANGAIYWDENATSQANTKKGETYLGKTVVEFKGSKDETLGDDSKMGGREMS